MVRDPESATVKKWKLIHYEWYLTNLLEGGGHWERVYKDSASRKCMYIVYMYNVYVDAQGLSNLFRFVPIIIYVTMQFGKISTVVPNFFSNIYSYIICNNDIQLWFELQLWAVLPAGFLVQCRAHCPPLHAPRHRHRQHHRSRNVKWRQNSVFISCHNLLTNFARWAKINGTPQPDYNGLKVVRTNSMVIICYL